MCQKESTTEIQRLIAVEFFYCLTVLLNSIPLFYLDAGLSC